LTHYNKAKLVILIESIASLPGVEISGYQFLDDERATGDGVIGEVSNLARLARKGFTDEVILAAPHDRRLTLRVLHEARRLRLDVEIVPDHFGCQPAGPEIERLGNLPVICLQPLPIGGLFAKRVVDVLGASVALLVSTPLLIAIATLIKLESSGCAIYAAQRAGREGRLFRCYKFRIRVSNADALKNSLRQHNQRSGAIFKISDDPSPTRRYPGDYRLWQVTARRDPSFQRSVELDREYIRTWNLGLDARSC
jgi:lipopolysaccharide/colanic/teichoic acid biosynthesis glycosyltransferase